MVWSIDQCGVDEHVNVAGSTKKAQQVYRLTCRLLARRRA